MRARHGVAAALLLLALGFVSWFSMPMLFAPVAAASEPAAAASDRASTTTSSRDAARFDHSAREGAPDAGGEALQVVRARVQVVDVAGDPVAGALVRYWPPRNQATRDADSSRLQEVEDVETLLASTGSAATTDASGWVEIVADPETPLRARRGDDYGEASLPSYVPSALGDVRIELRRDVALRVEVVDSDGRPAAGRWVRADVECFTRSRGLVSNYAAIGPTDGAGIAILRHALHQLEVDESVVCGELALTIHRGDSDSEPTLLAERRVAFAELQPQTSVRLTIPAGGTIVVTATDADGGPFGGTVWLLDEDGELFDQNPEVRDAEYVFRGVPRGRRWRIEASDRGMLVGAPDNAVARVVGPASNEEVVAVALQVAVRSWELRFRLVRSDGRPVEDATILARHPALGDREFSGTCDQFGKVRGLELRGNAAVADLAPLELHIESPFCRQGAVVVDRPIRGGTTDLGDVVVDPPTGETLLASVEVRAAGKNVTGHAVVEVYLENDPARPLPTLSRLVDGVIELRGVPPSRRMQLSCRVPGFLEPTLPPLRVGEHRVVELQPAASLCVAMRADGLPLAPLSAVLVRIGDEQKDRGSIDDLVHAALWWRVAPGRYRLRIEFEGHLVHEVAPLELRPGENRWPADGTRLDLRDKIRVVRIATLPLFFTDGPDLLAVEGGATSLPSDFLTQLAHGGWVVAPTGAFDVLVRGDGFVPQRLVNPTSDVVVPLQPCTWIDLEAAVPWDAVRVRIVSDAVADPLLRAFDCHPHDPAFEVTSDSGLQFAPGTVLELTPVRGGKPGTPQRVVVGTGETQVVTLR